MKFKILIPKIGNQFHFISNLAEWHFSCRRYDNKIWLEKSGKLTEKEKTALKEFTKILKKYHFGKKYLGIPFIRTKENLIWGKVKKWVSPQEYTKIQNIFEIFNRRFNIIWQKEKAGLKRWEKLISKNFIEKSLFKRMFMEVKYFLGAKRLPDLVEIYLFLGSGGGGANLGKGAITVECSSCSVERLKDTLAVLVHEIFHLIVALSPSYKRKLGRSVAEIKLSKKHPFYKNGFTKRIIIKEAVISALAPAGFIGAKYIYNLPANKIIEILEQKIILMENSVSRQYGRPDLLWRYFVVKELYSLTEKYFKNRKKIDKNYFDKIIDLFKQFNLNKKNS